MTLGDDINSTILLRNNSPLEEFLGLTPNEINYLLYDTFCDKSPFQIRNNIDNDTLNQIPLFRIAEEYLKIIQRDKQIKLTPLGALPKKVIVELYDKRILLDEQIETGITKLWKEQDCISILSARLTTEIAGLVKKTNGKLSLTKNGIKLIQPENRLEFFKLFLLSFTQEFLWSFNDGYPEQPIGQLGWAFSVFMLDKFGDQPRQTDFYAEKYIKAFPNFISFFKPDYSTPQHQFMRCYSFRTFDHFFLWFGFVTVEKQSVYLDLDGDKFTRTALIKQLFKFEGE
jgi:hypothetical protein